MSALFFCSFFRKIRSTAEVPAHLWIDGNNRRKTMAVEIGTENIAVEASMHNLEKWMTSDRRWDTCTALLTACAYGAICAMPGMAAAAAAELVSPWVTGAAFFAGFGTGMVLHAAHVLDRTPKDERCPKHREYRRSPEEFFCREYLEGRISRVDTDGQTVRFRYAVDKDRTYIGKFQPDAVRIYSGDDPKLSVLDNGKSILFLPFSLFPDGVDADAGAVSL
jgi:hypothetical protein